MLAEIEITPWHWAGFVICILVLLALDLGVFHRRAHVVSFKEALGWTLVWFALAMGFAFALVPFRGRDDAINFVTGYLVELALSMDNVFVMALIFGYFAVPSQYQHRVLYWGILGALVMRGLMIGVGAVLIARFHWMLYVFGGFLVLTGIKMMFTGEQGVQPEKNPFIRLARKFFRVATDFDGHKFTTTVDAHHRPVALSATTGPGVAAAHRVLTPLALVLVMVETTDLVFALDSIPAIFAVTQDSFIVFTSNVFAILGLRSLYFVLAGAIRYFHFLKYGLSIVLIFIGAKMLAKSWLEIPTAGSLLIVAGIIVVSIIASVCLTRRAK